MNSKFILFGVLVILVIAGIGGVAYVATKHGAPATGTSIPVVATTTPNYKIELLPNLTLKDIAPPLDHVIQFDKGIPQNARVSIQAHVDEVVARLKTDMMRADDWFTLGVLYHGADDFAAEQKVWEFLVQVVPAPDVAVAYDNLGKLYKFDLKDYPKSESYFMQSMVKNPASVTPYLELFELYRYLYKMDTTAAVDIITKAAAKFPKDSDPYVLLGEYYRDKGQNAKARDALTKALDIARASGNEQVIQGIGDELSRIPKE